MNKIWMPVLSGILMLISLSAFSAPTGYCVADSGTFHNVLPFSGTTITVQQNRAGQVVERDVDNGLSYQGHCYCQTDINGSWAHIYYAAIMNPALPESGARSGIQYYNLDEYLDVGVSFYILGKGYFNAPFADQPNQPSDGVYKCHGVAGDPLPFYSGGQAKLYFYIKQPFIGKIVIPQTLISKLYGTITPDDPLNVAMSDVYIAGDITAPQSCTINAGQIIEFDFKQIPASEFSSTAGTALTARKQTQTVNVDCTGMAQGQDVDVSLHASPVASDPTMIQTSNPDVGIKVYDEFNNEVNVNGGIMETEMGRIRLGEEDGSLTFSAAPASATGARPEPGVFDATATINVEIKN